jgi:hypothetical protein
MDHLKLIQIFAKISLGFFVQGRAILRVLATLGNLNGKHHAGRLAALTAVGLG